MSTALPQPGLAFRPDDREMITLLQRKLGDESFGASFIHEADAYSAAPEALVHNRDYAPGTDQGDGKGKRWYFWSPANCHESAQGGYTRRRQRAVRGAAEGTWHSETGKRAVPGEDDRTIGYIRKLSYGIKMKKRFTRLGWCMDEFGLESQDGADQLVLCRVYRSPRVYQAAACYRSREAPPPIEREPTDHESEATVKKDDAAPAEGEARDGEMAATGITVVMKFGGWSVASAERMRDVADLILSFTEEKPVVVLSAMGKTTNNLLLAGEKAVKCGAPKASEISELAVIRELHLTTIDELGLDKSIVSGFLDELEQLLKGIAMMKELTLRTRDYLVSYGECISTRIFAAYLNKRGKKSRQYDAFDLGFITTDDFTNADILEATYPAVAKRLQGDWTDDPAIPIVTGSLGKGWKTCAITTLGRGGGDLTATTIGKALGLREIQVWKDVDGVMTCDPKICADAKLVPYLTFDEAAELACFGTQAMQLAKESGITITVKNSCDPQAPGTVITKTRDTSKSELTSIALKSNITMLDIVRTRMLHQYDFLAKVFSILKDSGTSVDCVAISEGKISFTQTPSKLLSPELIDQELSNVVEELEKIAAVNVLDQRSIISLIGNAQMSSIILEKAFNVLRRIGVNVQMISPGASKVNVSLVVHDDEAKQCVQALHSAFLENGFFSLVEGTDLGKNGSPTPVNSAAAASSSSKRKVAEDHPETRPAVRRQTDEEDNILLADEVERAASSDVLDSSAASKKYTPGGEPAVPSCAERAETEKDPAPRSTPRQTDEEDIQRDDPTPMDDDLDVLASSKEMGSRVQGGETAMARSAPSEVIEEDAGTGSWTDHERMAPFDMLHPVPAECSTGMPCPASAAPCVDHPEAPQIVRQERTDTDGGLPEEITSCLFSDNNPMLDGVDDGGALAGLYFLPSILEVQDEQQGLAEAAEVGSGLRTEEEALPPELCQTARCRLCETELMDYYK